MKKIIIGFILGIVVWANVAQGSEVPDWVHNSAQKEGNTWLFSGSVYDISILNVAIPLARASALTNLASTIAASVDSETSHTVEGSEMDGYVQSILVRQSYSLDQVAAYGVRQREIYYERVGESYNVFVLLEVSDSDMKRAQDDFSKRLTRPKPVMKSREDGIFSRLIRKVGL